MPRDACRGVAIASPDPLDVTPENIRLIAAWHVRDRYGDERNVAPVTSGTVNQRAAGPEQRDGRYADEAREMRDARVGTDNCPSACIEMPKIGETEFPGKVRLPGVRPDLLDQVGFVLAAAPHHPIATRLHVGRQRSIGQRLTIVLAPGCSTT